MQLRRITLFLLIFSIAALSQRSLKPPTYIIAEVSPPDATYTEVTSVYINNRGEVAGTFSRPGGSNAAFYRDAAGTYLLFPGGVALQSESRAINDRGVISGFCTGLDTTVRAMRWTPQQLAETLEMGFGGRSYGINGTNNAVGEASFDLLNHPFLWDRFGNTADLLANSQEGIAPATAYAVNDYQQIVGIAKDGGGYDHAFIWTSATGLQLLFAGPQNSIGLAINNQNEVAGSLQTSKGWKAFVLNIYTGAYTIFPSLKPKDDSRAQAINSAGLAVGASGPTAALFFGGKTYDLNSRTAVPVGWTLTNATSINDSGQIAVIGIQFGVSKGFILTPLN